jgi:flagellar hook-length control protein FliK
MNTVFPMTNAIVTTSAGRQAGTADKAGSAGNGDDGFANLLGRERAQEVPQQTEEAGERKERKLGPRAPKNDAVASFRNLLQNRETFARDSAGETDARTREADAGDETAPLEGPIDIVLPEAAPSEVTDLPDEFVPAIQLGERAANERPQTIGQPDESGKPQTGFGVAPSKHDVLPISTTQASDTEVQPALGTRPGASEILAARVEQVLPPKAVARGAERVAGEQAVPPATTDNRTATTGRPNVEGPLVGRLDGDTGAQLDIERQSARSPTTVEAVLRRLDPATAKADLAAPMRVTSIQNTLAPAAFQPSVVLTPSAQTLVQAIEATPDWRPAPAEAASTIAQRISQAGTQSIKIQLQPVELGMVTAKLVASGSQLSIELQAETPEARQQLASDSDAIIKAMRAIGFDIDRITIQQPGQPAIMQGQPQANGGRDGAFSQFDQSRSGAGGQGTQDGRQSEGQARNGRDVAADRTDGGIYI